MYRPPNKVFCYQIPKQKDGKAARVTRRLTVRTDRAESGEAFGSDYANDYPLNEEVY